MTDGGIIFQEGQQQASGGVCVCGCGGGCCGSDSQRVSAHILWAYVCIYSEERKSMHLNLRLNAFIVEEMIEHHVPVTREALIRQERQQAKSGIGSLQKKCH